MQPYTPHNLHSFVFFAGVHFSRKLQSRSRSLARSQKSPAASWPFVDDVNAMSEKRNPTSGVAKTHLLLRRHRNHHYGKICVSLKHRMQYRGCVNLLCGRTSRSWIGSFQKYSGDPLKSRRLSFKVKFQSSYQCFSSEIKRERQEAPHRQPLPNAGRTQKGTFIRKQCSSRSQAHKGGGKKHQRQE